MNILAIETSCDETAIAVLDVTDSNYTVKAHSLYSQASMHAQYGGVFPNLAKREHSKNLVPLFIEALKNAELYAEGETIIPETLEKTLEREPQLYDMFISELSKMAKPDINYIAVTVGPGLEPALWVGVNFARALSETWNIPVIPTNHMEGHIASILLENKDRVTLPGCALLVSGGHTELILIRAWGSYEKIGQTLDDAAGEAFDKVARLLDLPYPGGPEISKLAEEDRKLRDKALAHRFNLPRPMISKDTLDFSYSGLKTAVLYKTRDLGTLNEQDKRELAREFEDTVTESLVRKVHLALLKYDFKTLIIAGGVIANTHIRRTFEEEFKEITLCMPAHDLATDNAVMIALAGYLNRDSATSDTETLKALGNLSL